jgi:hypothetical protein
MFSRCRRLSASGGVEVRLGCRSTVFVYRFYADVCGASEVLVGLRSKTSLDLHREFYTARQRAAPPHPVPVLSLPHTSTADLPGIRQALAATHHLLEMYRRGLSDEKNRRRLQRLDRRLLDVAVQLDRITTAEK